MSKESIIALDPVTPSETPTSIVSYKDVGLLPAAEEIRIISTGAAQRRFTMFEEVAIMDGNDSLAKVIWNRLLNADYCDLDFDDIEYGVAYLVNYFESLGLLKVTPVERVQELLKNGSGAEKYRGEL